MTSKRYVTIRGLDVRYASYAGVRAINSCFNSNVIIDSCDFYYNTQAGVQFYNGYNNATIQNCYADSNGNGYYANTADSIDFINNIVVTIPTEFVFNTQRFCVNCIENAACKLPVSQFHEHFTRAGHGHETTTPAICIMF